MVRSVDGVAPLPKGEACKRCKARKTRCSGDRPACQACLRSARFKHVPLSEVVCTYGDVETEADPRELGGVSNKAPRLSFDDRTSSASSLGSTSSGRSSFSAVTSSTVFSVSPVGYETDASSPPLSQGSFSYSNLSLPLPLPSMYPPIPLAHTPHQHRPPPAPAPPVARTSDPTVNTLASNMLDFGFSGYHPQHPQSLAARRRGIPLAIPLPQPPPFDAGFVPASAPPTLGSFLAAQQAYERSNEQPHQQQHQHQYQQHPPDQQHPCHQEQQYQPPSHQQQRQAYPPPPLPKLQLPPYESGAVDDWSLPTPVYSGGGHGGDGGGGGGGWGRGEGLPTDFAEYPSYDPSGSQEERTPQQQHYEGRPFSTGLSPWPRYESAGESWGGGGGVGSNSGF